jgi:hypothetical protein
VILSLSAIALGMAGCHTIEPVCAPDPGATGYAFCGGYAVQRYIYPAHLVRRAIVEAMQDMYMSKVKETIRESKEARGVKLAGLAYDGRLVCVTIDPRDEGTTIVTVRFDVYGDEPSSKVLLDRISSRLATLPPAVASPFADRAFSESVLHRGQDLAGYRGATLR